MAEFILNSRVHTENKHLPFKILYRYHPDFTILARKHSNILAFNDRLDKMAHICKKAEAALHQTKEKMKADYEQNKSAPHTFKVGNQVWLFLKDITIHQQTRKFGPQQLDSFKVTAIVRKLDYHFNLSDWIKIHLVFYVNRLSFYHDNRITKKSPPPPVIVKKNEKYEIKKLNLHMFRRQLQYLIQ